MPNERIYLDTNIVCNIRWIMSDSTFESGFYEFYSRKFKIVSKSLRRECMALRFLLDKDDQFALQFFISNLVADELKETLPLTKRKELLELVKQIGIHFENGQKEYLNDNELPPLSKSRKRKWEKLFSRGRLDFLPDEKDRKLIADLVLKRCNIFLTVDNKTIWNYRSRLQELGIKVQRPLEYLESFMFRLQEDNLGFMGPDDILNLIDRS